MKTKTFNFKAEKLFPFQFQLIGIIFLFIGVVCIGFSPYVAPILIIMGILILSAYRGIEFDGSSRAYREYNSFLFMKLGKSKRYGSIIKIFINSTRVSQKIYTRVTEGSTIQKVEYNAYLKFGNNSTLYLTSHKDKDALVKKLSTLADFFQLEISDNTT